MEENRIIEIIKTLRKEKGWTQAYMAEQLEITQSSYGKIERGDVDITISKLFKILKAINQIPEDFFSMVGEGGIAAFTYDDALDYQLKDLKSKKERDDAEIKYLNQQVKIKDELIAQLQEELNFTSGVLQTQPARIKPENKAKDTKK